MQAALQFGCRYCLKSYHQQNAGLFYLAQARVSQLLALPRTRDSQPRLSLEDTRHMSGAIERSEPLFLSVDEAPYRLREALYNKRIWKESFLTGNDHVFENLSEYFKPLQTWQNAFTHLIGAHNTKKMLETRKGRARQEAKNQTSLL